MNNQQIPHKNSTSKLFLEIIPMILFFILYKYKDIFYATGSLIISTIIVTFIKYKNEKKIFTISTASCVLLVIFGGLSLYTQDSRFIKIKVTIINLIFALVLFWGVLFKRGLAKYIYGEMIKLDEDQWLKISLRWALFFTVIAVLNEIIWRNLSEELWIKFKVFGVIPITMIFAILQIPQIFNKK